MTTEVYDCPACDYWHTREEPCLYDGCQTCGGTFLAPSRQNLCGICAEGERTSSDEHAPVVPAASAADFLGEEPF